MQFLVVIVYKLVKFFLKKLFVKNGMTIEENNRYYFDF